MALVGGQNASSSLSSQFPYVIFLSYRGEDTGKTFTDHLYTALIGARLRTFRDIDAIERGEDIKSQLQEAIIRCKSAIVVISKGYATSSWCLDELVLILQCRKTRGLKVLPIFYHVDPSHVRYQRKSFYKAFVRHEERFKSETDDRKREWLMNTLAGYRKALTEVANLSGMVLKNEANGYESKFIQEVVSLADKKLCCNDYDVAPYLVGVDARAESINLWLRNGSEDVEVLTLRGTAGIGKSTLAKRVFNMNCRRFKYSSFLENVAQLLGKPNGLSRLQRKLYYDILKEKTEKMDSVFDGINMIKSAVSQGSVLIVFDDVNQESDFEAIFQMRDWFCPGSKIIITTRSFENVHEPCASYNVTEMNSVESLELFSWHAFRDGHPAEDYLYLSNEIVVYCRGNPLALQISGASLRGQTVEVWKSMIEQLKSIPQYNVEDMLKISFDSLSYHGKTIFLDIACFFCGMNETEVIMILDACYDSATLGIKELQDRCLLTVEKDNKIRMHRLLQDMGREIVRKESPVELGKRSRLWRYPDSSQALRGETGTESIEGLALNYRRRVHFTKPSNINNEGNACFSISTKTFLNMKKLRFLEINYAQLIGDLKDFPENLHWLSWLGSPLTSLTSLHLDNLISLNMKHSNLEKLWTGNKDLGSLKILNLSHSHRLVEISDLSKVPALQKLVLKDCIRLVEIDESIGFAEGLAYLDLRDCKSLKKLPDSIYRLKFLETLDISGCLNLDMSTTKNDQLIPLESNNVPPTISASARTSIFSPTPTTIWPMISSKISNNSIFLTPPVETTSCDASGTVTKPLDPPVGTSSSRVIQNTSYDEDKDHMRQSRTIFGLHKVQLFMLLTLFVLSLHIFLHFNMSTQPWPLNSKIAPINSFPSSPSPSLGEGDDVAVLPWTPLKVHDVPSQEVSLKETLLEEKIFQLAPCDMAGHEEFYSSDGLLRLSPTSSETMNLNLAKDSLRDMPINVKGVEEGFDVLNFVLDAVVDVDHECQVSIVQTQEVTDFSSVSNISQQGHILLDSSDEHTSTAKTVDDSSNLAALNSGDGNAMLPSSHPIEWEGLLITQKARPILERVKAMHQDFLSGFVIKHGPYQLMFLEDLANLLIIVSSTKVKDMTPRLLDNVAEKMNDMSALGINLKFLQNRLDDIRESSSLAALELGLIEDDRAIAELEESVVRLREEIETRRRTREVNAVVFLHLKGKLSVLDPQMIISQDLF